jgi:hypothetical protein
MQNLGQATRSTGHPALCVLLWERLTPAHLIDCHRCLDTSSVTEVPKQNCHPRPETHTATGDDAAYASLGVVLVTADARLARAPGITCEVEVLA